MISVSVCITDCCRSIPHLSTSLVGHIQKNLSSDVAEVRSLAVLSIKHLVASGFLDFDVSFKVMKKQGLLNLSEQSEPIITKAIIEFLGEGTDRTKDDEDRDYRLEPVKVTKCGASAVTMLLDFVDSFDSVKGGDSALLHNLAHETIQKYEEALFDCVLLGNEQRSVEHYRGAISELKNNNML